jgi:trans-L-3-hydroxyproline dehydratase
LNVPSFVYAAGETITVPGIGELTYDVAYGGAFYAFCLAEAAGVGLTPPDFQQLIEVGVRIKNAVVQNLPIEHPFEDDLGFLYGTIFVGAPHTPGNHSRNVCVFADGELDRCPTGTGVSARAAIHHARGELGRGEPFMVESILGTTFTGEVMQVTQYGPFEAVIPKVTGQAHIVGRNEWLIDPDDPLKGGFLFR